MPKIGDITTTRTPTTFVNDGHLKMSTLYTGNRITAFKVEYKGNSKTFNVTKFEILKAWKQAEQFLIDEDEAANKPTTKAKSNSNARVKKQTSVLAVRALEARGLSGSKKGQTRKTR